MGEQAMAADQGGDGAWPRWRGGEGRRWLAVLPGQQGWAKPRLTREEVPDLLDKEPRAPDVFLHLGAAGAHLGLQALRVGLHLRGGFLSRPDLQTHTRSAIIHLSPKGASPQLPGIPQTPATQDPPGKHL